MTPKEKAKELVEKMSSEVIEEGIERLKNK
jgi:hypothetical protein